MGVKESTKRILGIKSGNRCAKPGCESRLVADGTPLDNAAITGQIAHIVSQSDTGPRADKTMPLEERDAEPNLVLLCREHHIVADAQENTYTVDEMRAWKKSHEDLVDQLMESVASSFTFVELEVVADAVMASPVLSTPGFQVTEVRDKMGKNALSDRVTPDLSRGMLGVPIVQNFIAQRTMMAPDFADRLRGGFVAEYERLYAGKLRGDDLFFALRAFAAAPHLSIERQMAGVAVLVHLFRICQVFEP